MTLFEPPANGASPTNQPVTLKRFGWSISRGVLLGAALAALLFAFSWAGALYETGTYDPWLIVGWLGLMGVLEFWTAAKAYGPKTALAFRVMAVAVGLGSVAYLSNNALALRPTEFAQTHPEFVTLVAVCGIVGLIACRGGLRLWVYHRSRASLWFAAAISLWFCSEWAVKLGEVTDWFSDPRVSIAFNTMIAAGVLSVVGVLALMDWNIRRREAADTPQGAPSEHNGLSNG